MIVPAFERVQRSDRVARPQFLSALSLLLLKLPEIRTTKTGSRQDLVISKFDVLQRTGYPRGSHGAYIKCGNSHPRRKVCNQDIAACGTR